MRKVLVLWLLIVAAGVLCPVAATAQSLADVARAEEARRKSIKQPVTKVYTNDDLARGGDTLAAPTAALPGPAPATTIPAGENKAAEAKAAEPEKEAAAAGPAKDEKYWRDRAATARNALQRSEVFLEALQARINALSTEFVNIDDPAHRAKVEQDRQRLTAELDRLKAEMAEQTKALLALQDEARRAGVPAGWLR